jgi:hypothetical protein
VPRQLEAQPLHAAVGVANGHELIVAPGQALGRREVVVHAEVNPADRPRKADNRRGRRPTRGAGERLPLPYSVVSLIACITLRAFSAPYAWCSSCWSRPSMIENALPRSIRAKAVPMKLPVWCQSATASGSDSRSGPRTDDVELDHSDTAGQLA